MMELTELERAALRSAAEYLRGEGDDTQIAELVPALYEDIFEELEGGYGGRDVLLAAHKSRSAKVAGFLSGQKVDPFELAAVCSLAIRGATKSFKLAEHLATYRKLQTAFVSEAAEQAKNS